MKLSQLLSKLEKSQAFKDFKKSEEAKNAFLCAGFIILNYKQNIFEYSLDFMDTKSIFTFKIPKESDDSQEITVMKEELLEGRKPLDEIKLEEIKKIKIDIEDIKALVEKELKKNKVDKSIDEIIAVIQYLDGKLVWHLTCMAQGFTIINIIFDAKKESDNTLKFEKKNLMDFVSVKKP